MNKKIVFGALTLAIVAMSCSVNEMEDINITSSEAIALNPSTAVTRASITYLSTLQSDANGFVVYAENGASPSVWNDDIKGLNNHVFANGKWNFSPKVQWPANAADYPMTFFAYYPQMPNDVITSVSATHPDVELNVTVPSDQSEQLDVLAGQNTANSKPASSVLSMNFQHILSKVFFSVSNSYKGSANTTQNAYVLAIGFNQLFNTNTYEVRTNLWGTPANTLEEYNYYNEFADLFGTSNTYTEMVFNSATQAKFYTGTTFDASYLMLLPQSPTAWNTSGNPTDVVAPSATEAYVRMWYRVEETSPANDDFIGYKSAKTHPDYAGSATETAGYEGPLYVLVGYSYNSTWIAGKGYQYDIPVPGTTGGRLLNKYYYDEQGHLTDLEVEYIDVPEVILPDDDDIHLNPIITDWDNNTNVNVIEQ